MDTLRHDVRYALRMLIRQPGMTATILLTLALGIGANTAVFSVVYAVLLRPLPYDNPDRLVMVWEKRTREGVNNNTVSPADYLDWARLNTSFVVDGGLRGDDGGPDRRRGADPVGDRRRDVGLLRSAGHASDSRPHLRAGRGRPRPSSSRRHQPRALAAALRWRSRHRRSQHRAQRRAATRSSACCRATSSFRVRPAMSGRRSCCAMTPSRPRARPTSSSLRPAEARRRLRGGARGDGPDRPHARAGASRRESRPRRARGAAARRDRQPGAGRAARGDVCRRVPPADRLHQRRQPAARAGRRPAPRDGDPRGGRRRARSPPAAVTHRKPAPLSARRRLRGSPSRGGRCGCSSRRLHRRSVAPG